MVRLIPMIQLSLMCIYLNSLNFYIYLGMRSILLWLSFRILSLSRWKIPEISMILLEDRSSTSRRVLKLRPLISLMLFLDNFKMRKCLRWSRPLICIILHLRKQISSKLQNSSINFMVLVGCLLRVNLTWCRKFFLVRKKVAKGSFLGNNFCLLSLNSFIQASCFLVQNSAPTGCSFFLL